MNRFDFLGTVACFLLVGCGAPETSAIRVGPGMPAGDAATPDGATQPDAAPPPDVAVPDAAAPDGPPPACVSGTRWTRGNRGSDFMNPGQACIQCHVAMDEGPTLSVAGTVFNDYHEENNCNGFNGEAAGVNGMVYVEVVDATGRAWRIPVNRAGNFFSEERIPGPFRRTRVYGPGGMYLEMSSVPPSGDCNRCHTQAGTNYDDATNPAPGRLIAPR